MAEVSPLRRRMIEDMTVRNVALTTQRSYVHHVAKFSRHFGRPLREAGIEDVRAYRARAISEPRAVLAEFGTKIPEDVEVRVSDSTAVIRYLELPLRPAGTEQLSEDALAYLVTRDAMIGVVPIDFPVAGLRP